MSAGVQNASSCQVLGHQSNQSCDIAVYWFSGWRPSAILDLMYACLHHPPRVLGTWRSLSLCKMWLESVQ